MRQYKTGPFVLTLLTAAVGLPEGRADDTPRGGALHHLAGLLTIPLGEETAPARPAGGVSVLVAEQDWAVPTRNLSCHTHTPLTIGAKTYARGVGTHANGRFVLRLEEPFTRLQADVGLDNNENTRGQAGSVVFRVLVDGEEKARTDVCRAGEPARALDVSVTDAREVEIRIDDAGDGISYDQCDLAEVRLIRPDGTAHYLEEALTSSTSPYPFLPRDGFPFRFTYADRPAGELLTAEDGHAEVTREGDVVHFERSWRLPFGVICSLEGRAFTRFEAIEYQLVFENPTDEPSRILEGLDSLSIMSNARGMQPELIKCRGGLTGVRGPDVGFTVQRIPLNDAPKPVTLTVSGGRSSNGDLPLFQVHDPVHEAGIYVAIGWSGQWFAEVGADGRSGRFTLRAAMPGLHLSIPPGERIITPRILLGSYQGDARAGGNALRRILYEHYTPLLDGKKPLPPISFNHWFTMGNDIDEARMLATAQAAADLGLEYFVIDAGWFDGGFPHGVGNWTIDKTKFHNGLGPISDFVREHGMKFGLWFEPERVDPDTRLAREHPEWVYGRLLDLGNKDAQDWVIDLIDSFAREYHIEWIRYDFNTDPLSEWEKLDTPDTRGLAQIRHMMGLYRVLDEIIARQPTLLIEGCSSGGRRIDLETIARSHTFWKSDHTRDVAVLRCQATGGNLYLPGNYLNLNLLFPAKPYEYHSLFAGPLGFGIKFAELSPEDLETVKRHVEQYRAIRRYLLEDYYPLFEQDLGEATWAGWQFHDAGDGSGVVIVIRKPGSPYSAATLALHGIDSTRQYDLTDIVTDDKSSVTGQVLAQNFEVRLEQAPVSRVWHYTVAP